MTDKQRIAILRKALVDVVQKLGEMPGWRKVEDGLPEPPYKYGQDYLVWIKNGSKAGGYRDTAAFGDYICEREDPDNSDPRYISDPDNDDGNWRGSGWHREEETHGGPYDRIFVDLNGDVTHYQPLPAAPSDTPTLAETLQAICASALGDVEIGGDE